MNQTKRQNQPGYGRLAPNETKMELKKQEYRSPRFMPFGDLRNLVLGGSSGTIDSAGGGPFQPTP